MSENAASTIVSAISLGVFWRIAPSTRAIIRSRKLWPGSDVTCTMIRSESTRVPPVTPERSPPASRMTGALSPVIALSSTEATPSTISPSAGMTWPASTSTRSPVRSWVEGTNWPILRFEAVQPEGGRILSRRPQAVGLGLAARFGQGLGEVREQDGEQQQEGQRRLVDDQADGRADRRSTGSVTIAVSTVPTSTRNMTGLRIIDSRVEHGEGAQQPPGGPCPDRRCSAAARGAAAT